MAVRVYEREAGASLHREGWINGARNRKAFGHSDRSLAVRGDSRIRQHEDRFPSWWLIPGAGTGAQARWRRTG
jgi:hypothetical protein